jgi:hypothetical protein
LTSGTAKLTRKTRSLVCNAKKSKHSGMPNQGKKVKRERTFSSTLHVQK